MVDDDGKVTEVEDEAPSAPPPAAPASPDERLVSRHAATAAAGALAGLAAASRRPDSDLRGAIGLGNGAMTLEDIVRTEMRPILKAWLDENLPPLVERLVQKEIKRITRQVDET
jgi:cell pole-organizing protein PopZ